MFQKTVVTQYFMLFRVPLKGLVDSPGLDGDIFVFKMLFYLIPLRNIFTF